MEKPMTAFCGMNNFVAVGNKSGRDVWLHLDGSVCEGFACTTFVKAHDLSNPLVKALEITNGARRDAYGHPATNFANIAHGWCAILDTSVTPEQVALCMLWLKMCRQLNKDDLDNLIDMAGYVNTLQMIREKRGQSVDKEKA